MRYEEVVTRPKSTRPTCSQDWPSAIVDSIDSPEWLEAEARHETSWISELEEKRPSQRVFGAYKTVMRPKRSRSSSRSVRR